MKQKKYKGIPKWLRKRIMKRLTDEDYKCTDPPEEIFEWVLCQKKHGDNQEGKWN